MNLQSFPIIYAQVALHSSFHFISWCKSMLKHKTQIETSWYAYSASGAIPFPNPSPLDFATGCPYSLTF